jgi:hypothetical protein
MSYPWETLEIEKIIESALIRDLEFTHGKDRIGFYTSARKHLLEDILEEIKKFQPHMTDHGPKHVKNVLENIHELLGDSIGVWNRETNRLTGGSLNGMELYILGLSALFHDVGNVFKREEHQKQIGPIYDYARPSAGGNQDSEEKIIILEICKAHCGDGLDGSKDTLAFVSPRAKLDRLEIRPNLLAPVLRFADELAEGEQRTSHFMIQHHKYPKKSIAYHKYAQASSIDIDRAHERIRLKYHITLRLPAEPDSSFPIHGALISLEELAVFLKFIYHRIEKVNQERQYAKHYCPYLGPFKETSASFNFWYRGREILVDLSPIKFSDLVVPGDPQRTVVDRDGQYKPANLIGKLSEAMQQMGAQEG